MSEATHLLIPIKDIKDQIEAFRQFLEMSDEGSITNTEFHVAKGCLNTYELLLSNKQISLNKEDIEKKANEYWTDCPDELLGQNLDDVAMLSYEQALKDLTK